MAKGFNASKFKSQIRQVQSRAERQIKSEMRTATRKIENELNRELRKYKSEVQRNQQRITREMNKLQSCSTMRTQYTVSLETMHRYYTSIDAAYDECILTPRQEQVLNLIEQEQINSLVTANAIQNESFSPEDVEDIEIGNKLADVSEDLNNRWKGAVFALNPQNPDAARHFCTSVREIFTEFIEMKAPDTAVFSYNINCKKTDRGNATRREKIKYMMRNLDVNDDVVLFAEADIDNILELFHVLSDGTHGEAGRYEFQKLIQVKKRVEQGINFLCEISA